MVRKLQVALALLLLSGCGVSRKELNKQLSDQMNVFVRNDMKRIMEISELQSRLSALEEKKPGFKNLEDEPNRIQILWDSTIRQSGEIYDLQQKVRALESKKCECQQVIPSPRCPYGDCMPIYGPDDFWIYHSTQSRPWRSPR